MKHASSPDRCRPVTLLPILCKTCERIPCRRVKLIKLDEKMHILPGKFSRKRGVLELLGTLGF